MLRTISGIIRPTSGTINFKKKVINRESTSRIVQSGLVQVPEGRLIIAPLTVNNNLLLGTYAVRKQLNKAQVRKKFDFVYELFPRLRERRNQRAGTLSGGEQQMLAVGRALMSNPELLLLDEPSLGLSPLVISSIFETLKDLNGKGYSVLLVEQNVLTALSIAHRGYVLERGRIAFHGTCEYLLKDSRVKEAYLS
jgi:branched-chain amino acid transport system ATP-binding protein